MLVTAAGAGYCGYREGARDLGSEGNRILREAAIAEYRIETVTTALQDCGERLMYYKETVAELNRQRLLPDLGEMQLCE